MNDDGPRDDIGSALRGYLSEPVFLAAHWLVTGAQHTSSLQHGFGSKQ
jgi:hypothetical protein